LAPVTSNLTAVTFPDGHDPAGILQKGGRQALLGTVVSQARPLADLVVDASIEEWTHGQELKFAEHQIGALRAAAKLIASMDEDQVGRQAARLTALYTDRFGWHPGEVTREIIDAIERHYQPSACTAALPLSTATAISRAVAPPRQQPGSDGIEMTRHVPWRSPLSRSSERG
jgi:DNA primase